MIRLLRAGLLFVLLGAAVGCRVEVILDEPQDAGIPAPDAYIVETDGGPSGDDAAGDPIDAGPATLPDAAQ